MLHSRSPLAFPSFIWSAFITIAMVTTLSACGGGDTQSGSSTNTSDISLLDLDHDGIPDTADNDIDNDGVINSEDLFPRDPLESADSDNDGVGNNADVYPADATCSKASDGDTGGCFSTQLSGTVISFNFADNDGIAYLVAVRSNKIYRYDPGTGHYLSPIALDSQTPIVAMTYSPVHHRIYVAHDNGFISFVSLNTDLGEYGLVASGVNVEKMVATGSFLTLYAQRLTNGFATGPMLKTYSRNGVELSSQLFATWLANFTWNGMINTLFFTSGNSVLGSVSIDQISGIIAPPAPEAFTPYVDIATSFTPLQASIDGSRLVAGTGAIYSGATRLLQGALGNSVKSAAWLPDGGLVTIRQVGAANQYLERRNAELKIVESVTYPGVLQAGLKIPSGELVITKVEGILRFNVYHPSIDTDGDGVINADDAFPNDAAAALDSDGDGFPDQWNASQNEAIAASKLSLDAFPQDSACYANDQAGSGGRCNFDARVPAFTPVAIETDGNGTVFLLNAENNRIYVWNANSGFGNPLVLNTRYINGATARRLSYSASAKRLFVGYSNGLITFFNTQSNSGETSLGAIPDAITNILAADDYIVARGLLSNKSFDYILNLQGRIGPMVGPTANISSGLDALPMVWDGSAKRVYFYADQNFAVPRALAYKVLNSSSGTFEAANLFANAMGPAGMVGPITLWKDGTRVTDGNGVVFNTVSREQVGTIDVHSVAAWAGNQLVTESSIASELPIADASSDSMLNILNSATLQRIGRVQWPGRAMALLAYNNDVIRVTRVTNGGLHLEVIPIADHDNDAIPGWWEYLYGLNDRDAADAVQDTDRDGLTNAEEYAAGTRPDRADSDSDGINDGDEVKTHHTNPLVADTDGDGLSDGDEIRVHHSNPLVTDTDGDGLNDAVEINTHHTSPVLADTDSDGMGDALEVRYALDPLVNDANLDPDQDGLTNIVEFSSHTNPNVADSDQDGLNDGLEVNTHHTDPTRADSDDDRMPDGWEITHGTNPLVADGYVDSDGDFYLNVIEYQLGSEPMNAASKPVVNAWTQQQGGPGHQGFVPIFVDSAGITLRWTKNVATAVALNPAVTNATGDTIYVAQGGGQYYGTKNMFALNAADGAVRWTNAFTWYALYPSAVANGNLYFQNYDANFNLRLTAVNMDSGVTVFNVSSSNQSTHAPTVLGNAVYLDSVSNSYPQVYNATDGVVMVSPVSTSSSSGWAFSGDSNYLYSNGSVSSSPNLGNEDWLYATARSTAASSYSINGGVSRNTLSGVGGLSLKGSLNNVMSISDGSIVSYNTGTRSVTWRRNISVTGQPAVALGKVYLISGNTLHVLDEATGRTLWTWLTPGTNLTGNVVVTMNMVFLGGLSNTYGIDLTRHMSVWNYPAGGNLAINGLDGSLLIAGANGTISVLNTGVITDTDGDGLPNWWENSFNLNSSVSDSTLDTDNDGLTNAQEFGVGTLPNIADSDVDGLSDALEINQYRTDPMAMDSDGDGLPDGAEVNTVHSNPLLADTDGDGYSDGDEVNVYHSDPNSAQSVPTGIRAWNESFEDGQLSATWTMPNTSNSSWFVDTSTINARTGTKSIRSGYNVGDLQNSTIQYQAMFTAGTLSFYAKVGAEPCCDRLTFFVDSVLVSSVSSGPGWTYISTELTPGTHTLKWEYRKDGSVTIQPDAAWVDDIVFVGR